MAVGVQAVIDLDARGELHFKTDQDRLDPAPFGTGELSCCSLRVDAGICKVKVKQVSCAP